MIDFQLHWFLQWLEYNQQWLIATIFLVSFLESLAIVGIVVPGVFILFGAAALAGPANIPLWVALLAAFFGAALGDGLSFLLGFCCKDFLRNWRPFSRYPAWLNSAETFCLHHGGKSILFGRFVGPLRPFMPLVAGMLNMSPWKFYSINIVSALGWAPAYILPGFFVGASIDMGNQIPQNLVHAFLLTLVVLILGSCILVWINRYLSNNKTWRICRVGLPLFAFAALILLIGLHVIQPINQRIDLWFAGVRLPLVTDCMHTLSALADGKNKLLLFLPLPIILWLIKQRLSAIISLIGFAGFAITITLTKYFVALPRPETARDVGSLYSFPSGHVSAVAFVCFLIALLCSYQRKPSQQAFAWSVACFITCFFAFSRLLLGDHWFGDVVGGALLGLASVALMHLLLCHRNLPRLPLLSALLLGFGLAALHNFIGH